MKKVLFSLTVIFIAIFAAIILFTTCKREECLKCLVPEPDVKELVTFNIMGKSFRSECIFYKATENNYYREIGMPPAATDEKLFQFLKSYCLDKNLPVDNQSMTFILYLDFPICQSYSVTDEQIKGISIYNVEGRRIIHHLFVRDENSDFAEIENVKVAVPFVTFNHAHFYLENYVFPDPQSKTFMIIHGDFSAKLDMSKYRTGLRFERKRIYSSSNSNSKDMPRYCPTPCPRYPDYRVCVSDGHGTPIECRTNFCVTSEAQSVLQQAEIAIESAFFDLDLMYSFRDDLLYNSEKGEEYIDNYYYLSDEYDGKIGFLLALQTAMFFRDFNPVMEALLNPAGHESEIMFDDSLTASLLNLLDEYSDNTKSAEVKKILKNIREDVNNFNNKTLQELLAMFQ